METNVSPCGFLEEQTSLVLSGFSAVVALNRTLLPDIPVACEGGFLLTVGASWLSDFTVTVIPALATTEDLMLSGS